MKCSVVTGSFAPLMTGEAKRHEKPQITEVPRMKNRIQNWMKMAAISLLFLVLRAVASAQSTLDSFDPNPNGMIFVVVIQPDGKILLGGAFSSLSPNGGLPIARNQIARLNADGTVDTDFNPNANSHVYSLVVQPDGKILAGGIFTSIGGQVRNRIARLDAKTGLADSFDPNASGEVRSIALQEDGKILVGGFFTLISGQSRWHIARLDSTTGLPDSFDPRSYGPVVSIVVQPDGMILTGGLFHLANGIGGQPRNGMARLDPATGLADSFDPNANSPVRSIVLQPDGKILVGGDFTKIGGQVRNRIARLDPQTGLADSFDPNANSYVYSIALQADGKVLAGGLFIGWYGMGGQYRNRIARLDPADGEVDSFNPNASSMVSSIAVQADGKIIVGGAFNGPNSIGGGTRNYLARLQRNGALATGPRVTPAAPRPEWEQDPD